MNAELRKALLNPWPQAAAIALLAYAVYLRTLAPSVMWYDMGEFQTAAYVLGIAHNTGYPLLLLLGKLFSFLPVGDVAYRVNLMSATFGALTVLMLYLIVFELLGDLPGTTRRLPAAIAALTLAFSSTLWSNATWATSYDLNAFLTLLILWLALRWRATVGGEPINEGAEARTSSNPSAAVGRRSAGRPQGGASLENSSGASAADHRYLNAAALTLGLGLGNHRLVVGAGLAAAYLTWRGGYKLRLAWKPALFFLLGFSVNLYLPLRAAQDPPVNWGDPSQLEVFLQMVTTGYARAFVNPFESLANLRSVLTVLRLFPVHELTLVGLGLAGLGAWVLARRDRPVLAASAIVVVLAAAMISVYGIHNIFNYFQPIYLMLAIWLGIGAAAVLELAASLGRGRQMSVLTEGRRIGLTAAVLLGLPLILFSRSLAILDRSSHYDARDYAAYLLNRVEPGSVILADFWSWAPLLYAQVVEGARPDVYVTNLLSQPHLDQNALVAGLAGDQVPTYVALGIDDSPRLQLDRSRLQLIAPYVIHYYPTSTLPLPQFKDLLLPKGAVYRVLQQPPDLSVPQVPPDRRLQAQFGDRLRLRGFGIQPERLSPGESFTAEYYWSVTGPGAADYWVEIQFADADQSVPTRLGIPIWLHSHWIGGEAAPTSTWEPGRIMREAYDGLVPRSVPPGRYFIWAAVFEDASGARRVGDPQGALLGAIDVVAP